MDQHALAGVRIAEAEQVGPYGEERFRYRSSLNPIHAFRNGQGLTGRHAAKLRVATAIGQSTDFVAQLVFAHAFAQRHDFTGYFQPWNRTEARFHRVLAGALQGVRPVDPGGMHADQDLAGACDGHLGVAWLQHFRPAGVVISIRVIS